LVRKNGKEAEKDMGEIRHKLMNMFSKVMAGTVSREEGAMLINHIVKEDEQGALRELSFLINNPPPNVYQKTILHSIALARNKAFFPLMVAALDHKNEDVAIFAANELARFRTDEAKDIIVDHLDSEAYHVRKASACALAQIFGNDGMDILKGHILSHSEPFYRATSAHGLLSAGKNGIEVLVEILSAGGPEAVSSAAEAIGSAGVALKKQDRKRIIDALLAAGDRQDTESIIGLLKAVASFRIKAKSYEGYVRAFEDHPSESVRSEARITLGKIGD
jgi:HEAT repeat protein